MTELVLRFVATYLVHSTALVGLALAFDRLARPRATEVRELILRAALFGSVLTAVVATTEIELNLGGRVDATALLADPRGTAHGLDSVSRKQSADAATATKTAVTLPAPHSAAEIENNAPLAERLSTRRAALALPRVDDSIAWTVLAAWLSIAGVALLRLLVAVHVQRRVAARLPRVALEANERSLARRLGLRDIGLVLDDRAAGPYVASASAIALPAWAVALPRDEREALLAHEFAHVLRRDPAWLIAIDALRRVFWFQPLAWRAQSRLDELAELSCDARAAHALGDGRSLALCLAACAEHVSSRSVPAFAPAMARRPSLFLSRVQRLLEDAPMSPRSLLSWKVLLPLGVCTLAFLLPTVLFEVAMAKNGGRHHSVSIMESNGHTSTSFIDSELGMSADIDGDITFTDDESDVAKLTDEAFIEQTIAGHEHRIDFKNDGGKVSRRYRVDGDDRPFDAQAKSWLAQAIPTLLRQTGIDAENRVKRIHAKGGTSAVLDEIALINGDYARREYLSVLSGMVEFSPAELDRILALVAELESDFERRTAYQSLIESQDFSPAQQGKLLQGVASMDSDFEQRTVLQSLIPELADDPAVHAEWGRTLAEVGSNFELRTIIESASEQSLSPAMASAMIAATHKIDSNFERRTALSALVRHVKANPALVEPWLASARKIDSAFERRTVLDNLLDTVPLDANGYSIVLDAAASMGSAYEQGNVLKRVARDMPADPALLAKYRQIAESLGDHEESQALAALGRRVD